MQEMMSQPEFSQNLSVKKLDLKLRSRSVTEISQIAASQNRI